MMAFESNSEKISRPNPRKYPPYMPKEWSNKVDPERFLTILANTTINSLILYINFMNT